MTTLSIYLNLDSVREYPPLLHHMNGAGHSRTMYTTSIRPLSSVGIGNLLLI